MTRIRVGAGCAPVRPIDDPLFASVLSYETGQMSYGCASSGETSLETTRSGSDMDQLLVRIYREDFLDKGAAPDDTSREVLGCDGAVGDVAIEVEVEGHLLVGER